MLSRFKRQPMVPDLAAVTDRALCLAAVAMLGAIAAGVEDGSAEHAQAAEYLRETHRWLIREQLAAALSARERALLSKSFGDWTPRDALDASCCSKALGVLLWALGSPADLPASDARFEQLSPFVPLLAPTADFRRMASLRASDELERACDQAEATSAAVERRYALNWLCGRVADWDVVTGDA